VLCDVGRRPLQELRFNEPQSRGPNGQTNDVRGGVPARGGRSESWAPHDIRSGHAHRAVVRCTALGRHRSSHSSAFLTIGTASSLSRGRILKGSALNPSHVLFARLHTEWRAQHSKMNEVRGGGSCTGRSKRIGPSLHARFWSERSGVVRRSLGHGHRSPHSSAFLTLGTASSLSRGRILKGSALNPSHVLFARPHTEWPASHTGKRMR
jgi:hypothetical protein